MVVGPEKKPGDEDKQPAPEAPKKEERWDEGPPEKWDDEGGAEWSE
jgi:hypothetical protein